MVSTTATRGNSRVISDGEAKLVNERLKLAAARGFAVDNDTLRHVLSRIAGDGRKGWKNNLPSEDAIRAYRASYRDISFKKI